MKDGMADGIVKRVSAFSVRVGGEAHRGWLPGGAATPRPTPEREVRLDIAIEFDGSGYLLVHEAADGSMRGDSWHETLADAERAAAEQFGVTDTDWGGGGA